MGPYCKLCGRRCFTPLAIKDSGGDWGGAVKGVPEDKINLILTAYGTSTIIATCRDGQ
jgi:hypothetical protein